MARLTAAVRIALAFALVCAAPLAARAASHAASPQAPQYEEKQGHMLLLNGAGTAADTLPRPLRR
jgi:hypothetical protein